MDDPFLELVSEALAGVDRTAPFDLLRFPADAAERFVSPWGEVRVDHDDLEWVRLLGPEKVDDRGRRS